MRKRILTGITTTGTPHIGNYIGAIKPALELILINFPYNL
jgi:tryptophanyl-tRNA synthetase